MEVNIKHISCTDYHFCKIESDIDLYNEFLNGFMTKNKVMLSFWIDLCIPGLTNVYICFARSWHVVLISNSLLTGKYFFNLTHLQFLCFFTK